MALTVEPSSRTRPAPRTRASKTDTEGFSFVFSFVFSSFASTSVSLATGQTVSAEAARSEKGVAAAPSLRSSATSAIRSPATTSPNSSSGCTTRTSARRGRHSIGTNATPEGVDSGRYASRATAAVGVNFTKIAPLIPARTDPGCSYETSSTVACAWSSNGITRNVLAANDTFVSVTFFVYFLPTAKS